MDWADLLMTAIKQGFLVAIGAVGWAVRTLIKNKGDINAAHIKLRSQCKRIERLERKVFNGHPRKEQETLGE